MPRFFFDVREGVTFIHDDEGLELSDIVEAEQEAAEAAASISRDVIRAGIVRSVTIEVRDEQSQRLLTVVVTLAIDRVQPPPNFNENLR